MIEATCHCRAVVIELDEAPTELTSCNCSICHRLGTLWTYHSMACVRVIGETVRYVWGDKSITLHHCATCGCTTHWSPLNATEDRMGVNARLLPPETIADVRVRRLDGANTWKFFDE